MAVNLSNAAAKRITDAVKKVERQTIDYAGTERTGRQFHGTFWAELTGEDAVNPGRYSFKRCKPDEYELVDTDPLFEVTDYTAIEVNEVTGLTGKFASITLNGYADDGKPLYRFTQPAEPLGEHQWQQPTMVSATQKGFSFNRVHGLLSNS